MFRTKYCDLEPVYNVSGSLTEPVYNWQVNKKTGESELVITGESNLDQEIQSHRDSCDLAVILSNIENGVIDSSVLSRRQGFYADTVGMPTTYADLFDKSRQCEEIFDNLPLEVKEKFDSSYQKFWNSIDDGTYNDIMASFNSNEAKEKIESEVIENEQKPDE